MTDPRTLRLVALFVLWYGFNASYNVYNARLRPFPHYMMIAFAQLAVGLLYALPLWWLRIRSAPRLLAADYLRLLPIALLNSLGHCCTVYAMMQRGGGSFTHVIKASEPAVSVLLSLLLYGIIPAPFTCLSLLPVCLGVAYASTLGDLSWQGVRQELASPIAALAMTGNVCFALRSLLRKQLPSSFKERTRLDACNDHAVVTIYSCALLLPAALVAEGSEALLQLGEELASSVSLRRDLLVCGLSFYLYNELQNQVLGRLGPVPTAVGNTLKRVAIFAALYLCTEGEVFPPAKVVGCAVAVAGCLVYALCDARKI
eukprot:gene31130-37623_t